jgi:hypothetical protein
MKLFDLSLILAKIYLYRFESLKNEKENKKLKNNFKTLEEDKSIKHI